MTAASNSDLIAALAPVSDDAESQPEIFERLNAILNFGFQQDLTPNERKALLAEYWRAVEGYPAWAIHRAIGSAQRATPNRRPTPGEIGIHCDRQVERIRAELRHRRAKADENAIEDAAPNRVTGEQAERIMQTLGFTAERLRAVRAAPSARTMDEAQAMASRPPRRHWTDGLPPTTPV